MFYKRLLFCSVLFFSVLPLSAHSDFLKALGVSIAIDYAVDQLLPSRDTNKESLAKNLGAKFLLHTAAHIFMYRNVSMGTPLDDFEENLSKIAVKNKWNAATIKRVKIRLEGYKLICQKLEEKSDFTIKTFHVKNDASFNAAAQGTPSSARIFITSAWLTTDKADDATILYYLEGVLAHELGHIALSHTFKNMCFSTLKNAALHLGLYWMNTRLGENYLKDLEQLKTNLNANGKKIKTDTAEEIDFSDEIIEYLLNAKKNKIPEYVLDGNKVVFTLDPSDELIINFAKRKLENRNNKNTRLLNVIASISLLQMFAWSRFNEYQADAWATQIVSHEQVVGALAFLENENLALRFPHKSKQELKVIKEKNKNSTILFGPISTHPAMHKRIARLQQPNIAEKSVWFDPSCYAWW